jgi:DNA-binding CsgD family transcriptional regulator
MGIERVFGEAGFKVVGTRTSSAEQPSWFADVFVIDPLAVVGEDPVGFVAAAAKLSPVLVLVGPCVDGQAYLEAGALGVVDRNSEAGVLVAAARAVMSGDKFTRVEPVVEKVVVAAGSPTELSPREEQVLAQIAHGLTHSQIARKLGISRHTVDTYVKRIRAKIDAGNKAELTRAAILGQFAARPAALDTYSLSAGA